jgi:hypothetical protein
MNTKTILTLALIPFFLVAFISLASAGSNLGRQLVNSRLLEQADAYNIVWDGANKDGPLFVSIYKDNRDNTLSNLDLGSNDFDVLVYEKNGIRDYRTNSFGSPSYRNYGYGRYGGYGYRGSSYMTNQQSKNFLNDNSERLYIDNTQNNFDRNDVERTGIIVAGNVINTNTLARASVTNTNTLTQAKVENARINAERDVSIVKTLTQRDSDIAKIHYNFHPRWDSNLGHFNWRY